MPKVCSRTECSKIVFSRGFCRRHYSDWYRRVGIKSARPRRSPHERFWPKVLKGGPEECWEWQGGRKMDGYGDFYVTTDRKMVAHRFAYIDTHGPIERHMQVDHLCFNRACVNPAHLRLATNKQNHENLRGATALSTTGVRGVFVRNGKYCAAVKHHGVRVYEEYFDSLDDAAYAVAEARQRIFTHSQVEYELPAALTGPAPFECATASD